MNSPQEVEVWVLMPAIRRQLAVELKSLGLKQKDISTILKVTVPAISQYINNKRAKDVRFSKEMQKEIGESAKRLVSASSFVDKEIQRILRFSRDTKGICKVCNTYCNTTEDCKICY